MTGLINTSSGRPVADGSRVTLHFSLLLETGEEIDTTRRGRPASFTMGDGSLLPGFERALVGMRSGDDAQIVLEPEDAFGPRRPDNVRWVDADKFADMKLEAGLVVSFAAADGELPGVVLAVAGDRAQIDFNHPLAGRRIVFDVSVLRVEDAAHR